MIDTIVVVGGLFVLGAAMGSFAAAQVWRLREQQLLQDKEHDAHIDRQETAEVRQLSLRKTKGIANDRSICLHCGRQLQWYELIPIVSWLAQGGKCRGCKQPIGKMELYAEVLLGTAFSISYLVWPHDFTTIYEIVYFGLWLIVLVCLAIHWMYDIRWFLLLDRITIIIFAVSLLYATFALTQVATPLLVSTLGSIGLTLLVLPGFYGLLYVISRGTWVGLGDVKLLVPFALFLPSWEYGVLLIFLANLIGCLALLPAMASKKLSRTTRVPFGPFLILAFVITFLFGGRILDFYLGTILF